MYTFCQVQDDPEGFWAFHGPFSVPRDRSGMCDFFFVRGNVFRPPCVIDVLEGAGGVKGREVPAPTISAAVHLAEANLTLKAWVSPTIFRLCLYLYRYRGF